MVVNILLVKALFPQGFPGAGLVGASASAYVTKPGGDGPDVATRRKGLISAVVVTSELKSCGGLGGKDLNG